MWGLPVRGRRAARPPTAGGRGCPGARSAGRRRRGAARAGRGRRSGRGRARRRLPVAANVAAARSYHEQAPAPATWRSPSRRSSAIRTSACARCPVNVGQPTWSSTTLSSSRSPREPQHGGDEVAAVRAEQPGGADDRVRAGRRGGDGLLAGELGAAVGALRHRSRPTRCTASARVAVEDVVRRDLDDERAGALRGGRDVAGGGAVELGRRGLVRLRAVDVGPRGAVDHRVRARGGDRHARGVGVADVELLARQRGDVVARARGGGGDVVAQHARGAGQEQAHRA